MTAHERLPILVVEADRELGQTLVEQLLADGFSAEHASTPEHARLLARARAPQLAILGWLGSRLTALELLREIRRAGDGRGPWHSSLAVIVIGPDASELELLRTFEAGTDDYLPKGASYLELRARVSALLRRAVLGSEMERFVHVGALAIDTQAHAVTLDERAVVLRRMEFELLVHLAREPQRVFARAELLRAVWGYRTVGSTRTLDSHASRLRRKLSPDGQQRWIVSVWGVGYRLM